MDVTKGPRAFLMAVMNDNNIDGALRIKAAGAILAADNAAQLEREEAAFQRFVDAGKVTISVQSKDVLKAFIKEGLKYDWDDRAPKRTCLSCGAPESLDGTVPCGH